MRALNIGLNTDVKQPTPGPQPVAPENVNERNKTMSAPSTNVERETKRHAPSLLGIGLAVLVGLVMGAAITFTAIERSDETAQAPSVMDQSATPTIQ